MDHDDRQDRTQATKQHAAHSPEDRAKRNLAHVMAGRLTGDLDAEQASQALQALNGETRHDE